MKTLFLMLSLTYQVSLFAQSPEWTAILDNNNSLVVNVEGRNAFSLDSNLDAIVDQQDAVALDGLLEANFRVVMNQTFGSEDVLIMNKKVYLQKINDKEY
jgi:hypothetical protein